MAKKQTRRTFSVSRSTHDAAMRAAAAAGVSCSEWVTELIRAARPDLLPQQTHVRPGWQVVKPQRLDLVTGDSFDRGEVALAEPPRPLPSRAELDALAATKRLKRDGITPGTFCANCIDRRATHRGRIDLTGAVYDLCDACELPAEELRDERFQRGYEVRDEGISSHDANAKLSRGLAALSPTGEALNRASRNETAREKTPGYLIVRVRRFGPNGRARDAREAFEQEIRHQPWAPEVHYLATDKRWHVFERPDRRLVQCPPSTNPLMWLEQYRAEAS